MHGHGGLAIPFDERHRHRHLVREVGHPIGRRGNRVAFGVDETAGADDPLTVLVPEAELEAAQDAIEALSEPDDIIAEP